MEESGIPLGEYVNRKIYRGVLTGFNKAFIIDGAKRAELIAQDSRSAEIIKPLADIYEDVFTI
ncbi:putative type II DNA modification enzyme [Kalymmatonema gypsitolerans NIES-4073]|nr:putative type II DNA modification enzyme [Scytonema sp. NIES-4073]